MDDALECLTVAIEEGVIPLKDEQDLRALLAALAVTFPVIADHRPTAAVVGKSGRIGRKILRKFDAKSGIGRE
jgi:hypothetical protein